MTVADRMRPRLFAVGLLAAGMCFGCTSGSSRTQGSASSVSTPGALQVQVTSVTATLLPYNPEFSNGGIPAEQVEFTISGVPPPPAPTSLRCNIEVFHSGRQVGGTTVGFGDSASRQSWSVEVKGGNFAGKPSDALVACQLS